jgi:uncharacterized protein (DUF1697 family)
MKYAAFLRGMNVGGHRLTNVELCGHIAALGFADVAAFLASGNVVFDAGRKTGVDARIEKGLRKALGYDVPTFLRTADEIIAIAERTVFDDALVQARGKEQVLLLRKEPSTRAARIVLDLATEDDRLELRGRELHWLPRTGVLDTGLDHKLIERTVGPLTGRTKNTIVRFAAKHFAS